MQKQINNKLAVAILIILSIFLIGCTIIALKLVFPSLISFPGFRFPSISFPQISFPSSTIRKDIKRFSSEEEFKEYLREGQMGWEYFGGFSIMGPPGMRMFEEAEGMGIGGGGEPERVSETTVQVPGIDEPDIVKTDGRQIYLSREGYYRGFIEEMWMPPPVTAETKIIKAFPPEDLVVTGKIKSTGNLLLRGNILVIFSGDKVLAYDVSEPASPQNLWEVKLKENSYVVGARLYQNKIYFITSTGIDEYRPCPIEPLTIGEESITIKCTDIYHPIVNIPADVTHNAFVLNPESGKVEKTISFVGSASSSILYMSKEGIYLTYNYSGDFVKFFYSFLKEECQDLFPAWAMEKIEKLLSYDISEGSKMNELGIILEKYQQTLDKDERTRVENEMTNRMDDYYKNHKRELEKTGIVEIGLDDFNISATGSIPGRILNQFSLDEHNDYLRIATTVGEVWVFGGWGTQKTANDVYVLDKNLKIVGSIQDLGLEERIYSVRFIEDKGYVVTFRQIDPFFVLDFSNPYKPELKGELKIPGYSSYLHPLTENRILGIGQEDWKVKISLFDISSAENPKEIDKYVLNEYWSDVSSTHHAFLQDAKHEIFFLPAGASGYIFSYKGDALGLKRVVSDVQARRAVYINDYLYIIGDKKTSVLNENNWEKINEIEY